MAGFWIGKDAPAVVNWCEPDYLVSPYVAEFWNTLSSLPISMLGVVGLWWWWTSRGSAHPVPRRVALCFVGLVAVGFGSMAFHGTMLRTAQALDELPMVWVGLVGAWIVRHRVREGGTWLAVGMMIYAVIFTVTYFLSPSTFTIFLVSYSTIVAYVTIGSVAVTWFAPSPTLLVRLLAAAAGLFLGALVFLWLPEHVFLGCDHPAQALQLHAWWHLGSGSGTFAWCLWVVADRHRLAGMGSRWTGWSVEPV